MNKQYRYVVAAIVTLVAASLAYLLFTRQTSAPPSTSNPPSTISNDLQEDRTTPPSEPAGTYTSYDPKKVASTEGTKLLFFHAPWCPQCRALEASINAEGVPEGVTIFKVDYDSNEALRQQYGVTIQTTVVRIDDDGNKLDQVVAYDDPSIETVQRELLQ